MKSKVIAVVGPTASGKTKLAIDIAKEQIKRAFEEAEKEVLADENCD